MENTSDYRHDFGHFPQNRGSKILKLKNRLYPQFLSTICARNLKFGQVGELIDKKKRYVGILPILVFYPYFDPLKVQN